MNEDAPQLKSTTYNGDDFVVSIEDAQLVVARFGGLVEDGGGIEDGEVNMYMKMLCLAHAKVITNPEEVEPGDIVTQMFAGHTWTGAAYKAPLMEHMSVGAFGISPNTFVVALRLPDPNEPMPRD
ncbi:hypothetical protein CMP1-01 [Clavibacter phage CMP1]|uniref:Uncharacterized protein n=1 Tax=Clavibacter phage CMP1 TaxID=686439 RepID=D0U1Y5_9CAUD|nr:hypothetical protein CMP1-01 [Clavibacter phage CMP1]ACY35897.1 hypothetical protein CMP1-01 [Clavibacter phage CMP1]